MFHPPLTAVKRITMQESQKLIRVTVHHYGRHKYVYCGLTVSLPDRREFFSKSWEKVIIKIDGKEYPIRISDSFWESCPKIRNKSLNNWIKANALAAWPKGHPHKVNLTLLGANRFELSK